MPFVTFTVRRDLSAADKSRLSEAMLEAQVAAGYQRTERFHRFLEVGRPAGTAATLADEAIKLFGERLHLAPQDVLFVFHEVEPNLPRFPATSIKKS